MSVLWKAFTDSAEFVRWGAPVASIDMKVGGRLEASYDASHPLGDPDNIVHRIITFIPERLIVFQNIQAPHMLPHAEAFQRTVIVLQYEPLGPARTRVTETVTGWGADPASNQLYAFFRAGNASVLEKMKHVYEAEVVSRPARLPDDSAAGQRRRRAPRGSETPRLRQPPRRARGRWDVAPTRPAPRR